MSLNLDKNIHLNFYLLFTTIFLGWKREDESTFMAYNSTKKVHLAG